MQKFLLLLCCLAFSLFAGPKANWILYPERKGTNLRQERYFRTEFEIAKKPVKQAAVFYYIDDDGTVMLNGQTVAGKSTRLSLFPTNTLQYDVTKLLADGRNVLSAVTINKGGNAGFILRLVITYQDGSAQEIVTDTNTWKVSKAKADGWQALGFDDDAWTVPESAGDYNADPWCEKMDTIALYANDDAQAELARRQQAVVNNKLLLEKLAREPDLTSEITYEDGGVFFRIGGKRYRPVLYNYSCGGRDTPNFRDKLQNFADADMHLISFGIEAVDFWKGPGQYDYAAMDRLFARVFNQAPDGLFIFAITFAHGPQWWNKLHPEETIKYASDDSEYDSGDNIGPYTAPSYASELWNKEASEAIRKLVEYIESTPYAKRVFGYRIGSGVYSEWHYFGMAGSMPDVSAPMTKLLRTYLRDKYNNDVEALRKAWNQPEVTFENAVPPSKAERLQYLADSLRDPVKNASSIDFLHCMQLSLKISLRSMNKAAKEACKGRALIGNYCGYFFGMGYTAEGWHEINDEFMDSDYVDFQIAPCCYSSIFRKLGRSQLARGLTASYPLHNKMCIFEADTRTHLTVKTDVNRTANTVQESIAMLSRDLAQAISKGSAYWYYDFGRDWYNCPEIFNFFHQIAPIYDSVKDFGSSADVAFIADWESVYYHAIQAPEGGVQPYLSINYQPNELNNAGIQFDSYSFADLDNPALQNYKLYIFPQLFYMTPEKQAKLNAIKKAGKTILFLNAAGCLTPDGIDNDTVFQTTGIQADVLLQEYSMAVTLNDGRRMTAARPGVMQAPVLKITDPEATILGTVKMDNGATIPAYAKKQNADGSVTYLCSSPVMTAPELRRIAKEIGVHTYCDSDKGVVFANNSMISFHTATPGEYTLHAKAPVKWTMVYPEKKTYEGTQIDLTFDAPIPETYIFVIEQ